MQQALSKQRKQQFRSDIVEVDSSVRSGNENLLLIKDTSICPLTLVVIYICIYTYIYLRLPLTIHTATIAPYDEISVQRIALRDATATIVLVRLLH